MSEETPPYHTGSGVTTSHLELEVRHLAEKTPKFFEALEAFLRNPDDPTGLRVSNLRMMAGWLKMDFERIDGLLGILENRKEASHETS